MLIDKKNKIVYFKIGEKLQYDKFTALCNYPWLWGKAVYREDSLVYKKNEELGLLKFMELFNEKDNS